MSYETDAVINFAELKMKLFAILLMTWTSFAFSSTQTEIEELKKRIEDLEKQQETLLMSASEPRPQVNSFLRDNFTVGGFFQSSMNFITGPDTETQAVNDSNVIGLNLAADFGSKFRFVSQLIAATTLPLQNSHNNPASNPDSREYNNYTAIGAVTQGYVEYSASRYVNIQAGLGYVPFGFALQLREPVLYVRREGPQLVRAPSLISILWQGFHVYGTKNYSGGELGYNLYSFTPTTEAKLPGLGGRVWMSTQDEKVVAGLNTQVAEKDDETYTNVGADLRFLIDSFQFRTEAIQKFTQNTDSWSGYVEPGIFIMDEEILLYAFGDYLFGAQNEAVIGASLQPDPIQKWEYGAGVNWLPTAFTRFRLGFTFHDYVGNTASPEGQNRDYFSTDVSVGVAF